ncbi:cyclase family protein [Phytohabitans suffuscus]|uniref:Cyclase n=1 Tax=Phytohabitans suffuscus TaxID=624315 RepID=A0A6F8YUI0_9ACTN|nr:cyclase family protein [Phytohabitans suffuscus]BCB89835.1 cyclase [Phytohabitans suffuscus]
MINRREYTADEVHRTALRHRTWGRWGPDDELGHANHLTADRVRAAAGLIRRGATFSLAIPMDRDGPQGGRKARVNPQHVMFRHGGDLLADWENAGRGMQSTDDAVYMALQSATQWDAFCHVFYDGRTYNDRGPETVTSAGALRNSITAMADRLVGRGVLLDLARFHGRPYLDPGEAIQAEDLAACAAAAGVEVGQGDIVLVRTGHLARRRAQEAWGDFVAGPAPGLGLSACDFLCPRGVAAVATDTWGVEVIPFESADVRHPVHVVLLVNAGVLIGEIWDLDALAADCAADGVYEFFLTAPPLTITGAVGSPLNPIAVK